MSRKFAKWRAARLSSHKPDAAVVGVVRRVLRWLSSLSDSRLCLSLRESVTIGRLFVCQRRCEVGVIFLYKRMESIAMGVRLRCRLSGQEALSRWRLSTSPGDNPNEHRDARNAQHKSNSGHCERPPAVWKQVVEPPNFRIDEWRDQHPHSIVDVGDEHQPEAHETEQSIKLHDIVFLLAKRRPAGVGGCQSRVCCSKNCGQPRRLNITWALE